MKGPPHWPSTEMIQPVPAISVIVPFFNEEDGVAALIEELHETVYQLESGDGSNSRRTCEVLLIDDGSTDRTTELLIRACQLRPRWRTVEFTRNCGQAAALYAGVKMARGEWLVLLDGDGQNDPADIPRLLALITAGADLAVGVRVKRRDDWRRRWMSRVANGVRKRFLNDGVSDTGCGLKALRREAADALIPIRTLYSFIPALVASAGFRVAEIPVTHRPRRGGDSKYGVRRFLFWPLLDMLGVWWFIHRRCSTECEIESASNIVALHPARLKPESIKA